MNRDRLSLLRSIAEAATPIPLIDGETVSQFMDRVQLAAREYIVDTFGKDMRGRVADAQGDRVVLDLWDYEGVDTFVVVGYTRDNAGAFDFGEWSEVRRVMNYVPVIDAERQIGEGGSPATGLVARLARAERIEGTPDQQAAFEEHATACEHDAEELIRAVRSRRVGCPVGGVETFEGCRWRIGDLESLHHVHRKLAECGGLAHLDAAIDAIAHRSGRTRFSVKRDLSQD